MNKKIFAGIGLSLILAVVVFLNIDRRSDEQRMLDAISWFIYSQTGEFDDYDALDFIKIDNEMLLEDIQLKTQLEVLQDTLSRKVTLLNNHQKLPDDWQREVAGMNKIKPDQIDDWMKLNAKLDLALSPLNEHMRLAPLLAKEEQALDLIKTKFMALNLSVYSIDLSGEKSVHYLHRFALDGEEILSVFEIDAQTDEVISYKQIG